MNEQYKNALEHVRKGEFMEAAKVFEKVEGLESRLDLGFKRITTNGAEEVRLWHQVLNYF